MSTAFDFRPGPVDALLAVGAGLAAFILFAALVRSWRMLGQPDVSGR